jgi:hypothetical protein
MHPTDTEDQAQSGAAAQIRATIEPWNQSCLDRD